MGGTTVTLQDVGPTTGASAEQAMETKAETRPRRGPRRRPVADKKAYKTTGLDDMTVDDPTPLQLRRSTSALHWRRCASCAMMTVRSRVSCARGRYLPGPL